MMERVRLSRVLALGIFAGSLLVACGGDDGDGSSQASTSSTEGSEEPTGWDAVVAAAEAEGKVVFYNGIPGLEESLTEGFKEAYPGIQLEIFRSGTADLLTRLEAERQVGGGADVVLLSNRGWFEDNVEDLVEPAGPAIEEHWSDSAEVYEGGRYVTAAVNPLFVAFNTNVLESIGASPIESYEDILQPEITGDLLGVAVSDSNAVYQYWYGVTEAMGDGSAEELASRRPVRHASSQPLAQALAAGEHAVGLFVGTSSLQPLIDQGAPIDYVMPDPAMGSGQWAAVVDWADHPNAALVFYDWLLSPAGQIAMAGSGLLYSPLPLDDLGSGVPDSMLEIPAGTTISDGVLTAEQQAWLDEVWLPLFG